MVCSQSWYSPVGTVVYPDWLATILALLMVLQPGLAWPTPRPGSQVNWPMPWPSLAHPFCHVSIGRSWDLAKSDLALDPVYTHDAALPSLVHPEPMICSLAGEPPEFLPPALDLVCAGGCSGCFDRALLGLLPVSALMDGCCTLAQLGLRPAHTRADRYYSLTWSVFSPGAFALQWELHTRRLCFPVPLLSVEDLAHFLLLFVSLFLVSVPFLLHEILLIYLKRPRESSCWADVLDLRSCSVSTALLL